MRGAGPFFRSCSWCGVTKGEDGFAKRSNPTKPSTARAHECKACARLRNQELQRRRTIARTLALQTLDDVVHEHLSLALWLHHGNVGAAAQAIGIGKATFYRHLAARPATITPEMRRRRSTLQRASVELEKFEHQRSVTRATRDARRDKEWQRRSEKLPDGWRELLKGGCIFGSDM